MLGGAESDEEDPKAAAALGPRLPPLNPGGLAPDALWARLMDGHESTMGGLDSEGDATKQFVHIDDMGKATMVALDKHELVRKWGVRFRDVVYIDPSLPLPLPSVVLVRARAILVHLDAGGSLRMVIAENQCLVLSVPKAEDPRLTALPTLRHPLVRRLCRCLRPALPSRITITLLARPSMAESGADRSPRGGGGAANGGGGAFDADMPYELRALEVGLAAAVGILSAEIDAFEERSYPVVDELLHSVERSVLEGVRGVKSGVDRLRAKVQRIHQEIEELLDDDMDMLDMYLGRRAAEQGMPPLPQEGDDEEEEDDEAAASSGFSTDGESAGGEAPGGRRRRHALPRAGGGAAPPLRLRRRRHHHGMRRGRSEPRDLSRAGDDMHAASYSEAEFVRARSPATTAPPSSLVGSLLIDPREIEDAEDLLESYYVRTDLLLRRLALVDERVDDTEDFVEIQLDQRRNEIVSLNLMVSAVSMAFGWAAAVGGVFGMNLINERLADSGWVLAAVMAGMLAVAAALFGGVAVYARRHKLMFIPTQL